jgi:hypothetical protein
LDFAQFAADFQYVTIIGKNRSEAVVDTLEERAVHLKYLRRTLGQRKLRKHLCRQVGELDQYLEFPSLSTLLGF